MWPILPPYHASERTYQSLSTLEFDMPLGTLTVLLQSTIVFVLYVLAQTGLPGIDSGLVQLIGTGATGAVLVWYVVYDVRVRTPSMLKTFADDQAASRKTFSEEAANDRALFTKQTEEAHRHYNAIVESLRQAFLAEQATARQIFAAEQNALRTQHEKEVTKMQEMLFQTLTSMRTAVHDVKDTANTLILKKALTDSPTN